MCDVHILLEHFGVFRPLVLLAAFLFRLTFTSIHHLCFQQQAASSFSCHASRHRNCFRNSHVCCRAKKWPTMYSMSSFRYEDINHEVQAKLTVYIGALNRFVLLCVVCFPSFSLSSPPFHSPFFPPTTNTNPTDYHHHTDYSVSSEGQRG